MYVFRIRMSGLIIGPAPTHHAPPKTPAAVLQRKAKPISTRFHVAPCSPDPRPATTLAGNIAPISDGKSNISGPTPNFWTRRHHFFPTFFPLLFSAQLLSASERNSFNRDLHPHHGKLQLKQQPRSQAAKRAVRRPRSRQPLRLVAQLLQQLGDGRRLHLGAARQISDAVLQEALLCRGRWLRFPSRSRSRVGRHPRPHPQGSRLSHGLEVVGGGLRWDGDDEK